ncbi:MAG: rod shape-determining protein RodA [Peptococcaceae bacterium]|nr:rod shape-determining protein RodA [Peptococcaceae bacterium]
MAKKNRRKSIVGLDLPMLITLAFLLGASLLILSTASYNVNPSDPYHYVKNQVVWIITGIIVATFVAAVDYEYWRKLHWWIYGFTIFLLVLVFIVGSTAKGAQRWIPITSSIGIQPSEFAKVFMIITFAKFLADRKGKLNSVKSFILPFLYILPAALLIFLQPDLGSALVFGAIFIGMMFVAGAHPIKFGAIIIGALGLVVAAIFFHVSTNLPWPLSYLEGLPLPIKDYQLDRLLVFIDPQKSASDDAYHVVQSIWAIGSGGLWGKGYMQGTQGQYNFLPEHHTDFIFSVVGEEFGFIGTSILLFVFCIFILRIIAIGLRARDHYGMLITAGVASMLVFHIFVNVGMVSGIMPVTGIPLPFITSGGSSMLANMIAVGMVINVGLKGERPMF